MAQITELIARIVEMGGRIHEVTDTSQTCLGLFPVIVMIYKMRIAIAIKGEQILVVVLNSVSIP